MSMLRTMRRDPARVCPYYARGGKCRTGCWTEPFCVTGAPLIGWPWARLLNRARMVKR